MKAFCPRELTLEERATLDGLQAEIDAIASYEDRVRAATNHAYAPKKMWSSARLGSAKAALEDARPPRGRCVFCEQDTGNEVEHVLPRALHPGLTYVFNNLVMVCGPCNKRKGARHAIVNDRGDDWETVTRGRNDPVVPPKAGLSAFINPHEDDPSALIELDILGDSFLLRARETCTPAQQVRVKWTVDECLELNVAVSLTFARRLVYGDYLKRLSEYIVERDKGALTPRLDRLRRELLSLNHPTVWNEMKRQHGAIPELAELFLKAPEALSW